MGRRYRAVGNQLPAQSLHAPLQFQIYLRPAGRDAVYRVQVLAAGQVGRRCRQPIRAQQCHRQPAGRESGAAMTAGVVQQSQPAHDGRREYRRALAFVVQAHVAAYHGQAQRPASVRHTRYTLLQLVVNIGPLRVAEIEAVGQRQRLGADA